MSKPRTRWMTFGVLVLAAAVVSGCPLAKGGGYLAYPLALDFSGYKSELTVNVTSYCAANGPWKAAASVPWLAVSPDTGAGEYTQVTVAVTRPVSKAMEIGKNTATIRFTFTGGVQKVPVTAWLWPESTFEESFDEGDGEIPFPKQGGTLVSNEYLNDVEVSPDGGYLGVGYIDQTVVDLNPKSSPAAKSVVVSDAYVIKTDTDGEKLWSINWGGDGWTEAYAAVVADDGNYVIAGWQAPGFDVPTKGLQQGFYVQLTKVSPDGLILWQKVYGDGTWWAWGIQKTADGGFIIAGDNSTPASDAAVYMPFLIKTDADGNEEWSKLYDTLTYDHFVYGVDVADNGTFIVVGESFPFLPPDKGVRPAKISRNGAKQPTTSELFLMRTLPNGSVQWREEFGGPGEGDYGRDVIALPGQSGYMACGASESYDESWQIYLVKVDITGAEVWHETYEIGSQSQAEAVVRDDGGNFMIAGWTNLTDPGKQPPSFDALLLKVDDEGVPSIPNIYGDEDGEQFHGLRMAPDGGYIAGGRGWFEEFIFSTSDVYLVKTNDEGEVFLAP
ncbi:MAG: BACON domain-containing protein [bacterium]|nr:BACON domain-containing protein [bacterium]